MTIGKKIKDLRTRLNLSVDELAAKLGKNRATVYRYESGDIENLPLDVLKPLSEALDTTPGFLMGWEENRNAIITETKNGVTLGDYIKTLRIKNNVTLEGLSEKVGIPTTELKDYESGNQRISVDFLYTIVNYFKFSAPDLIGTRVKEGNHESLYITENQVSAIHFEKWHKEFGHIIFTDEEHAQLIKYAKFLLSQRDE